MKINAGKAFSIEFMHDENADRDYLIQYKYSWSTMKSTRFASKLIDVFAQLLFGF